MNTKEAIRTLRGLAIEMHTPKQNLAIGMAIEALKRQPDFQKLGRKGGLATKATHKPDYFRRIGKLGGRPKKKQNGNPSQNG